MILFHVLLALHLLAAVAWVGGMAFALMVLRPSLGILEPAQRLALHAQVFRRFFLLVWHAMVLVLLTGFIMLFVTFGGFAGVNPWVHVMLLLGLIMSAIFLAVFFGPWREMRAAPGAAVAERIRALVGVNLALGVLTIIVAAFAR
ncbi:MAG: CopD family protein [Alphaproteobacteria bacterium]|nr:CopD family protein [Alphaproteobacteria bacterium]